MLNTVNFRPKFSSNTNLYKSQPSISFVIVVID